MVGVHLNRGGLQTSGVGRATRRRGEPPADGTISARMAGCGVMNDGYPVAPGSAGMASTGSRIRRAARA